MFKISPRDSFPEYQPGPRGRKEKVLSSVLLVEKNEGLAILTLNRPQAKNALNMKLHAALYQAFTDLQGDPDIGAVILTGAGSAFCAGLDLKELSAKGFQPRNEDLAQDTRHVYDTVRGFDRPIIGAVNGAAVTGGFELALMCDILIASTEAVFADTHARVGVVPGWGISQKLPRIIGAARAKELSFTGNFLFAETAERWGLVNRVVPPEELMPACLALARDILSCHRDMIVKYKRLIDQGGMTTLAEGLALEARMNIEHALTLTPDSIAGQKRAVLERGRDQKVPRK